MGILPKQNDLWHTALAIYNFNLLLQTNFGKLGRKLRANLFQHVGRYTVVSDLHFTKDTKLLSWLRSLTIIKSIWTSQAPRGFGTRYRSFPAFLARSNCLKTAKLRRLLLGSSVNRQSVCYVTLALKCKCRKWSLKTKCKNKKKSILTKSRWTINPFFKKVVY